jgi:predicted RNA-binding Zn-ribbon protein involved in translation (DUF1610 family)
MEKDLLKDLMIILKQLKLFDKSNHKVVYHRAVCSLIEFWIEKLRKEIQQKAERDLSEPLRWIARTGELPSGKTYKFYECPKCKSEYIQTKYRYCPHCGQKLSEPER